MVVLIDRDLELLILVGLCGYLSSEQLARELFPTADRCRRRLRQLYDAGLLAVTLQSSTAPNLVSLTAPGVAVVAERKPEVAPRLRRPGALRFAGVEHHLAVVDARLYAAALGAKRGAPLTRWEGGQGEFARSLGLDQLRLEPDGIAEFATPDGRVCVAVEVDNHATEPLSILSGKFERYEELASVGVLDALWVVVKAGAERQRAIAILLDEYGLGDWGRVLDYALTLRRPAVEPSGHGSRRAEGATTASSGRSITSGDHRA